MPNEPSQLPKQQFSVSNADTRSQTRIQKLEERLRRLESGTNIQTVPALIWKQPTNTTATAASSASFTIDIPTPVTQVTTGSSYGSVICQFWWKFFLKPTTAGTCTGSVLTTVGSTQSAWTYGTSFTNPATFASSPTGTATEVGGGVTRDPSMFVVAPVVVSSPYPTRQALTINISRTGGTAATLSIESGIAAVIVLPGYTTAL